MYYGINDIIDLMKRSGYQVFLNDTKPFNLNLVCIRSSDLIPDTFNDLFIMFWKFRGAMNSIYVPVTADAGLYWLKNPFSKLGTAIVKKGQYKALWRLGKHRGKYEALVQKSPVTVLRDYNKDEVLDYNLGREETGLFGINHHRASEHKESKKVNKYSAGCIVTANPDLFDVEMEILKQGASSWGNSFSFSMLHEEDFK